MWNILWLFLCVLGARSQSAELAIISEKNFTQNLEGANVTITCEARNLDTNPVSWYFNDEQIAVALTEDEKSIVYLNPGRHSSKYSLTSGPGDGGNFTFTIHNLSLDDIGVVSCRASNAEPADHRIEVIRYPGNVQIEVISQQSILLETTDLLIVEAGFNDWLNLSCIVMNSRPSVNTAWFWNDTSPVAELDLTAVETVEENNRLFNSSSNLFLSPAFLLALFGFNVMNETNGIPDNSTANTSSLYNDMLDENLEIPNLINFLGTSINLTCRASLEEWRSAKSILVEVDKDGPNFTENPGGNGGAGSSAPEISSLPFQVILLFVLFTVKMLMLISN